MIGETNPAIRNKALIVSACLLSAVGCSRQEDDNQQKRMEMSRAKFEELKNEVGQELGVVPFVVTQKDADLFSAITDDWDYMHNDPKWAAANSEWEGTIAHGLYVLSLVPSFCKQVTDRLPLVSDDTSAGFALNYDFDRVRFVSPLLVGAPARAHITLLDFVDKGDGSYRLTLGIKVYPEGNDQKPTLVAENVGYYAFED